VTSRNGLTGVPKELITPEQFSSARESACSSRIALDQFGAGEIGCLRLGSHQRHDRVALRARFTHDLATGATGCA
jgi:hypothetical protein